MKSGIVCFAIISLFLFSGSFVSAQSKADTESIHKLIDKYGETEDAGDMVAQAKLFSSPQPTAITLVLEKKGDWKIVHTHSSSLNPSN